MFRAGIDFPTEDFNIIFNQGGLGDLICRLVAVKYLSDTQKHLRLHVYIPDYAIDLAKHLVPNVEFHCFSRVKENPKLINQEFAGRNTDESVHTLLATHLIDQAFHILVDQQVDIQYKNYLAINPKRIPIKKFNLPENYLVITTGFTANVREMPPTVVNNLADYAALKGYKVVFLGSKQTSTGSGHLIEGHFSEGVDYSKGINLIDKTSLLEAAKIIGGAKAIIGLDNGLIHLAGCTDTAIVAGFTTVSPEHRAPIRKNEYGWNFYPVVPPESLKCRGCQSRWAHVYNHDFRNCWYKEKGYDTEIQCVKSLTANLYIEQLEKIL